MHISEVEAELELADNISKDPNSLKYSKDDTPLKNIMKRHRCQVELYKTVYNLRTGRYYGTGHGVTHSDGITSLDRELNKNRWEFFDSPELFSVSDEGTYLKKLLSVFSIRPTLSRFTMSNARLSLDIGRANINKLKLSNLPVVNVKLPFDSNRIEYNKKNTVSLEKALKNIDYNKEDGGLTIRNREIIYSNQVAFFYVNRKHNSINLAATTKRSFGTNCMTFRNVGVPLNLFSKPTINNTKLLFNDRLTIGNEGFRLKSIVALQKPLKDEESGTELNIDRGCVAIVAVDDERSPEVPSFLLYDPAEADRLFKDTTIPTGQNKYVRNSPITYVKDMEYSDVDYSVRTEAQERGTIFFYSKC
jgi:hypothetical protein